MHAQTTAPSRVAGSVKAPSRTLGQVSLRDASAVTSNPERRPGVIKAEVY